MNENEITLDILSDLPEDTYVLYDIRDGVSYAYGTIPGALNLPDAEETAARGQFPAGKKIVLFCMYGEKSAEQAERLRRLGVDAYTLEGGYAGWLKKRIVSADRSREIERALEGRRKFKERLFQPFTKAIVRYKLVEPGDRIAVCISGGKDSMLMAKLFQQLKKHDKFPFELVFLVMDPGYNELNRTLIENNARTLGVPVHIFETRIFDSVYKIKKSPCYLCARMRRGYLYAKAKELGCNKIALGHHFDDVIETTLMGMLWGGQMQGMLPKLRSTNYEGMELIRPMYFVREDDIKAWRDYHGLHFIQCACRFTDTCSSCREDGTSASKRMETKLLIKKLKETNPNVEINIFNSMNNVCVDTLLAYKLKGERHEFLDNY